MTVSAKIYAIGTLGRSQAALRAADGVWFMRERRRTPFGLKWTPWQRVRGRPPHAWYDPRLGEARLPDPDLGEDK